MVAHADALATRTPGQLVEAQTRASHLEGDDASGKRTWPLMFRPVVDGDLVTSSPLDAFEDGASDAVGPAGGGHP